MKPYYEKNGATIYHGDAAEIVPTLTGIDLVGTDPPYGVGYAGGHFHSGDVKITRDREPLAGDDGDVYHWAIPLIMAACSGPCYCFFAGSRSLPIFQAIDSARGTVHAMIIWHKTNAKYAAMNSQYKQRHEPILYFKGPNARTNWTGPTTESTVWEMPRNPANTRHPTEKPTWILERMIKNHAADLVLDPFMGSGSTLVAAANMGRKSIGIDLERKYCDIAARQLDQELFDY